MNEIDSYINQFSDEIKIRLNEIRKIILDVSPSISEVISYGMPGYKLSGKPLVYFAGYKHHIGFYATPSGHSEFAKELSQYKQGKGSVQLPLDRPLPLDLIRRIVVFRYSEVEKQQRKSSRRTCTKGHVYMKSSDCPTCPECERLKKPTSGFLAELAAPARRAFESAGIDSIKKLASFSRKEVLGLHGVGKSSIPILERVLKNEGLKFRED